MSDLLFALAERLGRRARTAQVPHLREALAPAPGLTVLDVGGGTGLFAQLLARGAGGSEPRMIVLEPDPGKLAFGRARRPQFAWLAGTAERIPLPPGSVDRVLALASFHHVHDQQAALREFRRVLKPGGWLVLKEYAPSAKRGRRLAWFEHRVAQGEAPRFWEPEALRGALLDAGFAEAEERPVPGGAYVLVARVA